MDTIDGMRTFVTVVKEGSFTAAAGRRRMSTALVSKYVGQLEDHLGVRLLNRTTRSLTLTEIGAAYFERCQQILDDLDELESSVQDRHASPRGTLIISAPVTFGELYLTDVVARFLAAHPDVRIDLNLTDRFVNLVDEGVDVAIRIAELEDSPLIARRLAPARIVVCASPVYLKRRGALRYLNDLEKHDCIVDRNFRSGSLWQFKEDGKQKSIQVDGRFTVNNAASVRRMLLADMGVGLIPTFAVGPDIRQGRLKILLDAYEGSNLGVYAVYAHNRHLAGKVRAFVDFAVKCFGASPEWDQY
ncbi:LysR family transcriptional regulator [Limibacillus halophilus]|uniref:DNA-binding transcriptional LysR family regulator n=1 Tax=Limibacillus halophilus TaxID=1579333 RepID=A0A839SRB5_9PROT|nr:LysR family transcriptional regulator [Limibacillus halophilus]MBB3064354.1 DNA-binding transcriptional LysR family regulator [Limibacillus halophilus]